MVAVVANLVLSLVGFFLVKNTIERDEQTRVGPLLAATSLDSRDYLLGKCVSNFLLLMSLSLVFMASIPFLQWHRGPQYPFEPLKIVTQFLLMVAPTAAFIGALAVLWESIPLLKRGLGNVLYIILWMALLLNIGIRGNTSCRSDGLCRIHAERAGGGSGARAKGRASV